MKKFFAVLSVLALGACASTTAPYYEQGNFLPLQWAKMSFEQARADCKSQALDHNAIWGTYELQQPIYKACMEKNGFKFQGQQR